jgi:hypothetical protein
MYISKHTLTIDTTHNNSSTGIHFHSTGQHPNGLVYAVEYIQSTGSYMPSTAVLSLYVGSTVHSILKRAASTSFFAMPRNITHDTTGGLLGATTAFPGDMIPLDGTLPFTLDFTGGTSAATTGLMYVYVQGV